MVLWKCVDLKRKEGGWIERSISTRRKEIYQTLTRAWKKFKLSIIRVFENFFPPKKELEKNRVFQLKKIYCALHLQKHVFKPNKTYYLFKDICSNALYLRVRHVQNLPKLILEAAQGFLISEVHFYVSLTPDFILV